MTGLGLSITALLVGSRGGTVGVTSQLGDGSRFTVNLPVAVVVSGSARQAA